MKKEKIEYTIVETVENQYTYIPTNEHIKKAKELGIDIKDFMKEYLSLGELFENSVFDTTLEFLDSDQSSIQTI